MKPVKRCWLNGRACSLGSATGVASQNCCWPARSGAPITNSWPPRTFRPRVWSSCRKYASGPPSGDEMIWFRERNREMHDLLHVTAGYGRDPLGEACVLAFSFAQTGQKGFAVIATVAAFRIARRLRSLRVPRAVFQAYRQGRRAEWLIGADWENLLGQPPEVVRARFKVTPATYYPRIPSRGATHHSAAAAAAQSAQPAVL